MLNVEVAQPGLFDESSRHGRERNIAIWFIRKFAKNQGSCASAAAARRNIREECGWSRLTGESYNGDLRAHGDACGGHGLHLDHKMVGDKRYLRMNEHNLDKCITFLHVDCGHPVVEVMLTAFQDLVGQAKQKAVCA